MKVSIPLKLVEQFTDPPDEEFLLLERRGDVARIVFRSLHARSEDPFADDPLRDLGWMPLENAYIVAEACAARIGLPYIVFCVKAAVAAAEESSKKRSRADVGRSPRLVRISSPMKEQTP